MERWIPHRELREVEELLRVYCHDPSCPRPDECPLWHPRCAKHLGYHTSIAWAVAHAIREVLNGEEDPRTVWSQLELARRVVRWEYEKDLYCQITRAMHALRALYL